MIRKTNTASGSYLLRRAAKLAKSIVSRFGIKHEFFDGFIVRGRRVGKNYSAEVYDPPAWLVVVGTMKVAAPTDLADSLVIELPQGRDALNGRVKIEPVTITDEFLVARPQGLYRLGEALLPSYSAPTFTAETAFTVRNLGHLRGYNRMYMPEPYQVNLAAFVDRSAVVLYQILVLAPQLYRARFALQPNGWSRQNSDPSTSPLAMLTIQIDDSFLRQLGALPFSMRQSPPPYDPADNTQTYYSWAQVPWQEHVAERYVESVDGEDKAFYRATLWSQVVVDMIDDNDSYGARGIWVVTVRVAIEERAATVTAQFLIDHQEADNPYRRPRRVDNGYLYNAHLRTGGEVLNSGTAVFVDAFMVSTDGRAYPDPLGNVRRYASLDIHWVDRQGIRLRSQVIQDAFDVNTGPHDMKAPIGMATDGQTAVVIVFSTPYLNRPSNFDVILIGEDVARVVYSDDVSFFQCLGASSAFYYSTGRPGAVDNWGAEGAGGSQVCYIGNGKYLFYVSSRMGSTTIAAGDWAAAVYDINANSVAVVGVIDPEIETVFSPLILGRPVCLSPEDPDSQALASILATRGGSAQAATEPGTEQGDTWISADSGATWTKIADYGSPAGVMHAGNIIQSRI
ncbi:hypothetical protein BVH03_21860 [Pseudomonas sp. PA15(2017)]|uniref:hypothetical protein n=1 Tax=Pseudomonas sp. PA15(2017) TaxID=1932111 RepID=UPI00095BCCCF|nr:hypothetical protein [Pseudomonas sp. PA15(2017)]OLU22901.1 hypothetical protein BVH03_21860 [Pseudomonas sp. PA15(2017)]